MAKIRTGQKPSKKTRLPAKKGKTSLPGVEVTAEDFKLLESLKAKQRKRARRKKKAVTD